MTPKQKFEPQPPRDIDAERSVLGAILIDGAAYLQTSLIVQGDEFYSPQHADIYRAMGGMVERGEAINQVTLCHELERDGTLEDIGGAAYLAECVAFVPTSLHAEHYATIVHKTAIMRKLIQAGAQITRLGFENDADLETTLGQAEELLAQLRQTQGVRGFHHIRDVLEDALTELVAASVDQERPVKVQTGYSELERITGGLHGSDLIILAARPSMGKTSLLLNISEYAALKHKAKVAIFSLEMSKEQLVHRLIASNAGVELQRIRLERLTDTENRRVMEAAGLLSETSIWIDDSASQGVAEMRSKAKRLANQHGLDLVVVDYIGLVRGTNQQNRVQEVAEISHSLKALAKELDIPVLVASQLNRTVESRNPHIPILSDLRESGDLEQDADVVLFIYREDMYVTEDEWPRKNPLKPYPKGMADIIVAKHRNGPLGVATLIFHERTTRFLSVDLFHQPEERYHWQT